jgi:hypothetical protein
MTLCCRRKDGSNRDGMFEEVNINRGERAGNAVGGAQLPCSDVSIFDNPTSLLQNHMTVYWKKLKENVLNFWVV